MILTEATQERATPLSGQPAAALGIIKNKKNKKNPTKLYSGETIVSNLYLNGTITFGAAAFFQNLKVTSAMSLSLSF